MLQVPKRKDSELHDHTLPVKFFSIPVHASSMLVLFLFLFDFFWELFLEEGHELRVEVIYIMISIRKGLRVDNRVDLQLLATITLPSRHIGQRSCFDRCIKIMQRMQKT